MKLLAQGSWWTLNKTVTKYLDSLEASLILTLLCDMHDMHPDKDLVWLRQEDILETTGLSYYKISKAIDLLESKNLIYRERETQTLQPKMLYRVLDENIVNLFRLSNSTSIGGKSGGRNNNNSSNNNPSKKEVRDRDNDYSTDSISTKELTSKNLEVDSPEALSRIKLMYISEFIQPEVQEFKLKLINSKY